MELYKTLHQIEMHTHATMRGALLFLCFFPLVSAFYWVRREPMLNATCPPGEFVVYHPKPFGGNEQETHDNSLEFQTICSHFDVLGKGIPSFRNSELNITYHDTFYYSKIYNIMQEDLTYFLDDHGKHVRVTEKVIYAKIARHPFCKSTDDDSPNIYNKYTNVKHAERDIGLDELTKLQYHLKNKHGNFRENDCYTYYEFSEYGPEESPHPLGSGGIAGVCVPIALLPVILASLIAGFVNDHDSTLFRPSRMKNSDGIYYKNPLYDSSKDTVPESSSYFSKPDSVYEFPSQQVTNYTNPAYSPNDPNIPTYYTAKTHTKSASQWRIS